MSYLVLARKYRPSTFAEVVGQDHVTRTLENAFATGRVHHAFLFCGPRGCGKTTLARIVGKALNCQRADRGTSAGSTAEPCGVCAACASISSGSAVDYQEMDGASNRGIDAIRELTEAVRYQPAVLRKKVYVIDEVHMLTPEAFNALLKTLEEPPPHVTFVLATTEPHKLPNTILSRCQRYDFKLVPASRLAQHLASIFAREQLAVEPGALSLVVRESGGSVRDALSLCDQLISYVGEATMTERHVAEVLGVADRALTRTLVRGLAGGDAGAALAAVESAIERGVDEVQIARAIVRYLRDLSVLQVAPDRPGLVDATDEELAELQGEAAALERSRITQMFERMLRCCDELGKTLQPRLILDCALIDVATIEPLVPLGDLIDRLTELEGRIAGRAARTGGGGGAKDRPRGAPSVPPGPRSGAPTRTTSPASGTSPAFGTSPASGASVAQPSASASGSSVAQPSASAARPSPAKAVAESRSSSPGERVEPAGPAGRAEPAAPIAGERSSPVSMQPSGPVPRPETVAAGSGPHDDAGAVIAVPKSDGEVLRAWNQVLDELEARRKGFLRAHFEHARVMRWTAERLELGFAVGAVFQGEMANENAEKLGEILRTLGPDLASIKVVVRLLDESESSTVAARSVVEDTQARSSAERSRREAEAREHPITKHVLQTFGAQIKEIKTDV